MSESSLRQTDRAQQVGVPAGRSGYCRVQDHFHVYNSRPAGKSLHLCLRRGKNKKRPPEWLRRLPRNEDWGNSLSITHNNRTYGNVLSGQNGTPLKISSSWAGGVMGSTAEYRVGAGPNPGRSTLRTPGAGKKRFRISRVGGGALARWPPSAAQTAGADFPRAAFTKT
jgi:hypothetical protein